MTELRIPVSPDQEDVIVDYVFHDKELGLVPDEKAWMLAQARKVHPNCKIISADLDFTALQWVLELQI